MTAVLLAGVVYPVVFAAVFGAVGGVASAALERPKPPVESIRGRFPAYRSRTPEQPAFVVRKPKGDQSDGDD